MPESFMENPLAHHSRGTEDYRLYHGRTLKDQGIGIARNVKRAPTIFFKKLTFSAIFM
jgi:hypothetical protein